MSCGSRRCQACMGRAGRANKTRRLVLPAPAFIIASLAVIIFNSVGAGIPRPIASGADTGGEYPPLRCCPLIFKGRHRIFGGNRMPQSDIDSLLKEDRL